MSAEFGDKETPVLPPYVAIRDEPEVFLVPDPAEIVSYSLKGPVEKGDKHFTCKDLRHRLGQGLQQSTKLTSVSGLSE